MVSVESGATYAYTPGRAQAKNVTRSSHGAASNMKRLVSDRVQHTSSGPHGSNSVYILTARPACLEQLHSIALQKMCGSVKHMRTAHGLLRNMRLTHLIQAVGPVYIEARGVLLRDVPDSIYIEATFFLARFQIRKEGLNRDSFQMALERGARCVPYRRPNHDVFNISEYHVTLLLVEQWLQLCKPLFDNRLNAV